MPCYMEHVGASHIWPSVPSLDVYQRVYKQQSSQPHLYLQLPYCLYPDQEGWKLSPKQDHITLYHKICILRFREALITSISDHINYSNYYLTPVETIWYKQHNIIPTTAGSRCHQRQVVTDSLI